MNVILIISDTFRYDNLLDRSPFKVETPNLDRFHERAVSASRMYAASFPTIPHRTDLLSGRYTWPFHPWQEFEKSTRNFLPVILRKNKGMVSQVLGDCPHLVPAGVGKHFDGWYAIRGQENDIPFLWMNREIKEIVKEEKTSTIKVFMDRVLVDQHCWQTPLPRFEKDCFCTRTADMAVNFLENNYLHEHFLLWIDFFDPHEPWDAPQEMIKKYDPDYDGPPMMHCNYGESSVYTEAELNNMIAHYCAEVELVDRGVGRILQKIDDCGLWDNSIVIFTADHGISIGEHERTGKCNRNTNDFRLWPIYTECAQIPFLIAAPGLKGGTEIDALLQPVDITPTILDLIGAEKAEIPQAFHGSSFLPLLTGQGDYEEREFVITASYRNDDWIVNSEMPVVYTKEWAYVPCGPLAQQELYNIKADPMMTENIIKDHASVAEDMNRQFFQLLEAVDAPESTKQAFATMPTEASGIGTIKRGSLGQKD